MKYFRAIAPTVLMVLMNLMLPPTISFVCCQLTKPDSANQLSWAINYWSG